MGFSTGSVWRSGRVRCSESCSRRVVTIGVSRITDAWTRSELFFLEKSEADFLERKLLPPVLG